jgi:2-polyprenyl-3-methyl-5-hydroxy-6-metoxy-1,4-benzoquinol methylase
VIARFLDPCRAAWVEALRIPPRTLRETVLWELQTFFDLPRDEVLERCRSARARIAEAWRRAGPRSAREVDAFYREPLDYAFELLWWHSFATRDRTFLSVLPPARHALRRGARRALDFGGGVGSHAIALAALDLTVTLADVSEEMLRFAGWRAELRGRPVRLLHVDRESLDEGYDFVAAIDVLEHLPGPAATLAWLGDRLRMGGWLFLSMPGGPSADVPQHISFWGRQLVVEGGLREVMRFGPDCLLFEKTGPVRARGAPPQFDPLPPGASRRAILPAVSPALWLQQTLRWHRAPGHR